MRKILIPIVDKIHIVSENFDPPVFQARNKLNFRLRYLYESKEYI